MTKALPSPDRRRSQRTVLGARVCFSSRLPWRRHPPAPQPGAHLRFQASAPALGFLFSAFLLLGEMFAPSVSVWPESFLIVCVTATCVQGFSGGYCGGQTVSIRRRPARGRPHCQSMLGPWAPMTGWSFIIYLMVCNFYGFVFPVIKSCSLSFLPSPPQSWAWC